MKKQFYSFEELQRKKQRVMRWFIGSYVLCMSVLIALILWSMAR
jgi:hypothetical protein